MQWYIESDSGYKSYPFPATEDYAYEQAREYAKSHAYETITLWSAHLADDWWWRIIANKDGEVFEYEF